MTETNKCEFCGCELFGGNVRRCCQQGMAADTLKKQDAQSEPVEDEAKALTYSAQDLAQLCIQDALTRGLREPFSVQFAVGENAVKVVVVEDRQKLDPRLIS